MLLVILVFPRLYSRRFFFKFSKKWIVKYAIYYLLLYHKYLNACFVSSNILESGHIKMKTKKWFLASHLKDILALKTG